MWFLCFCFFGGGWCKKEKRKFKTETIDFVFWSRKLLTEKMKQTTTINRAVLLCVTGSSSRIVLKFSSLQLFLCSPPNTISRVPSAVGYMVLDLLCSGCHVCPSLSHLIWERLLSFLWTARPLRFLTRIPANRLGRLLGAGNILFPPFICVGVKKSQL